MLDILLYAYCYTDEQFLCTYDTLHLTPNQTFSTHAACFTCPPCITFLAVVCLPTALTETSQLLPHKEGQDAGPAPLMAGLGAAALAAVHTAAADATLVAATTAVLPAQVQGMMAAMSASTGAGKPVDKATAHSTVVQAAHPGPSMAFASGEDARLGLSFELLTQNVPNE